MPPTVRSPADEPTVAEYRLLQVLSRYHYLLNTQVARALDYSDGAFAHVKKLLSRLKASGYIEDQFLDRTSRFGKPRAVYSLAPKGVAILRQHGTGLPHRVRSAQERRRQPLSLRHTLAVNDVLLAAECLARENSAVEIRRLVHERTLRRELTPTDYHVAITDANRRKLYPVIPDAFVEFVVRGTDGKRYSYPVTWEIDLDTEEDDQFKRKIQGLLQWHRGGQYERFFGTADVTYAFHTPVGARRRDQMRRLAEAVLTNLHAGEDAELFYFSSTSSTDTPSGDFFFSGWYSLFSSEPAPLLDVEA